MRKIVLTIVIFAGLAASTANAGLVFDYRFQETPAHGTSVAHGYQFADETGNTVGLMDGANFPAKWLWNTNTSFNQSWSLWLQGKAPGVSNTSVNIQRNQLLDDAFTGGNWTYEIWFDKEEDNVAPLMVYDRNGSQAHAYFFAYEGDLRFAAYDSVGGEKWFGTTNTPITVGATEWRHAAVTYANGGAIGGVNLYLDGQLVATNTEAMPMGGGLPLFLGPVVMREPLLLLPCRCPAA